MREKNRQMQDWLNCVQCTTWFRQERLGGDIQNAIQNAIILLLAVGSDMAVDVIPNVYVRRMPFVSAGLACAQGNWQDRLPLAFCEECFALSSKTSLKRYQL